MNWEGLDPSFVVGALGPVDPEVNVLWIEQDGKLAAALVNFGLHPAVLAGDNWLYSADYPGYLSEATARLAGSGFVTVFFNGCCGNVNHIDYRDRTQGRGYQMTQRIGYMLAVTAFHSKQDAVPVEGDEIKISREKVRLKRQKISDEQRRWSEEVLRKAKENPARGQVDGLPDEYYALTWLEMYKKQNTDDEVELMTVRLGNMALVGIPGEMFSELGMEIKKLSPTRNTLVIELANDAIGYLPAQNAFAEGGYESSTGSTTYEKGAGEELVASALRQLNNLFS
jgi:hypothetical protein